MKKYKLKLDYTADELEELKRLGGAYDGPIAAVYRLGEKESINDPFRNLRRKYRILDIHKEFAFMTDINNVVMGTAIFPEEKYVVHDKVTDQYIYYSFPWKGLRWGSLQLGTGAERKTKEEWLKISPAYELMLESVKE
jgi:hypothetical protein